MLVSEMYWRERGSRNWNLLLNFALITPQKCQQGVGALLMCDM